MLVVAISCSFFLVGCDNRAPKPLLKLNELTLSDLAIDGITLSWSVEQVNNKLGKPREVVRSPGSSQLLIYSSTTVGITEGALTMIGGNQLRVAGNSVEPGISLDEFATRYGVSEDVLKDVGVGSPSCVVALKDVYLQIALRRREIVGYQAYRR